MKNARTKTSFRLWRWHTPLDTNWKPHTYTHTFFFFFSFFTFTHAHTRHQHSRQHTPFYNAAPDFLSNRTSLLFPLSRCVCGYRARAMGLASLPPFEYVFFSSSLLPQGANELVDLIKTGIALAWFSLDGSRYKPLFFSWKKKPLIVVELSHLMFRKLWLLESHCLIKPSFIVNMFKKNSLNCFFFVLDRGREQDRA